MKKFLSLVMALIMVMSLVTVASAADYTDAADVDMDEAVDVMSTVGVFQGSAGKFNPKGILNRAEAAKLIAYLDLGEKTAEALPAVQVFADVPATHWAAKFIAYCTDAGYINGVGNGNFDPTGKLTGYQFGKLLLCVLGYDATIESFVGANWSIAVAKLMKANDIADGVDAAPSGELTREAAAQYCLNALKATMVEYENKGSNITINGANIATGASKWTPVVEAGNTAIDSKTGTNYNNVTNTTVELGEKLYDGDLVLAKDQSDDFGRPAVTWTYDNDKIGDFSEAAVATFTAETSKTKVATALKGYTICGYKVSTDVKGTDTNLTNPVYGLDSDTTDSIAERLATNTANGAKVEVFANSDKEIDLIVYTTYNVAKVTNVSKKTNGDIYYTLKDGSSTITAIDYNENSSSDDNFVTEVELAKDVVVTYVLANSTYYFYPTTTVTGVITEFKGSDYAIVDGTKYPLKGDGTVSVSSDKVELTVDQFGAIVKSDAVDKTDDTVYLAHKWSTTGSYGSTIYMAQFVDQAGKITEIEVENEGDVNYAIGPCKYYVTSDDTAWVSAAGDNAKKLQAGYGEDLTTKTVKLASAASTYYYLADDVTFINMNGTGSKLKTSVATGAQKVTKANAANSYMVLDDGEVIAVFVPAKADSSVDQKDIIFVASSSNQGTSTDLDGKSGTLYSFYLNGEKVTKIASFSGGSATTGLFKYTVDAKTGRYSLTQLGTSDKVYSETITKNAEGGVYNVSRDAYLTFNAAGMYDLRVDAECTFLDTTDNNIVDIPTLVNAVKNAPDDDPVSITVFAVYDDKAEVITALYLK